VVEDNNQTLCLYRMPVVSPTCPLGDPKIGMAERWNSGMIELWKITPNLKSWNDGSTAENHFNSKRWNYK